MLITLAFEDSPAEIQRAQRIIVQLIADRGTQTVSPNSELAQQWWAALDKRIGPEMHGMAEAAARLGNFGAWQELADKLDVTVQTVQSWHRNAGRSIKRVNAELGTDYQLFRWDRDLNKFSMPNEVRIAILGT
jgi:superfamily II DNA or RNA helicase